MNTIGLCLMIAWHSATAPVALPDSLNIMTSGHGVPVVFVPGLFGSAYGYRELIAGLDSAAYRSIVIEPLGFGGSARPKEADYSLTAQADRLAVALDTLVDGPVVMVAHSVGASIAYRLAYRHPHLVAGILSLEGGATETLATPGFRSAMKFSPVLKMIGPGAVMGILREQMRRASADGAWVTDEVIMGYTTGVRRDYGAALDAFKAMSRTEEPESLADNLNRIVCPVVVLLGNTRHHASPRQEELEVLRERVPDLTVELVEAAGHFVHEEAPDAVVGAIVELAAASAERRAR